MSRLGSKRFTSRARCASTTAAALLGLFATLLAAPPAARAFNCGGHDWQTITVSLGNNNANQLSTYTISTFTPTLSGCGLSVTRPTVVTITLPGDTNAASITTGTLNGVAITFTSHTGQTVTFDDPTPVDDSNSSQTAVVIVLNTVTNPSTAGAKTLTLQAGPAVGGGAIGPTDSTTYTIINPTATPTNTPTLTPSVTPTRTDTPTPTTTLTPSNTPTVTNTPTPTATATLPLCTQFGLNNPCVPGGGKKATDCYMEWGPTPVPTRKTDLTPKNLVICYEGDPACDVDGVFGNNSCTINTRICINNTDPRNVLCSPTNIATFKVKNPNPARLRDSADTDNLATLEAQGGTGGFNVIVLRGTTALSVGPPNGAQNSCSQPLGMKVPVRIVGARKFTGRRTFRIVGTDTANKIDSDILKMQCRVSTCGDGIIQSDHETCDDNNHNNGDGCNAGCHIESGWVCSGLPSVCVQLTPTPTNTGLATSTPTNTPSDTPTPGPSNTPTDTGTVTNTPQNTGTPTPTATVGSGICGNGIVEAGEDCDDGGTCIGDSAGTACTSDAGCSGQTLCIGGQNLDKACSTDGDCPGGRCGLCKAYGGDGCAANCTTEKTAPFNLVPGVIITDPNDPNMIRTIIQPGTSGAFVHGGPLKLPVALSGSQTYTLGKQLNGQIPMIVKTASVNFPAIKVDGLACACVRAQSVKSCGGTIFDPDGITQSTDCTPGFIDGTCSVTTSKVCRINVDCPVGETCIVTTNPCASLRPCAFVHGPGNSTSGTISCTAGLPGINLSVMQDSNSVGTAPPPVGTPPPGSGPSMQTFSGTGVAGDGIILNTSSLGFITGGCSGNAGAGADKKLCTADDPSSTRGAVQTLPLVTGMATGLVTNSYYSDQVPTPTPSGNSPCRDVPGTTGCDLGPFTISGAPFSCGSLTAPTPSTSGSALAGVFTALNQATINDVVVTNNQFAQ